MALIKCPECKKEVSNTIETCIHCGFKLTNTNVTIIQNNQSNNEKINTSIKNKKSSEEEEPSGCAGCGCIIFIILILVALFFGVKYFYKYQVNKTNEANKVAIELQAQEKERKKLANEALSKLTVSKDDITGITWYTSPIFTHSNNSNAVSLKISIKDNHPTLYIKMSYSNVNNVHGFDTAYLSYEGTTLVVPFKNSDYNSDSELNLFMETFYFYHWIDTVISDDNFLFLSDFAISDDAKMRLSGQYSKTRNLSIEERLAMQDILNAYQYLAPVTSTEY